VGDRVFDSGLFPAVNRLEDKLCRGKVSLRTSNHRQTGKARAPEFGAQIA